MISDPSVVLAGLGSVAFDIKDGVDLTDEDIIRTICAWIDKGQVAAVLWQQTRACSFAPKSLQHVNMMRRFGCLLLATAGPVHDVVAGQWAVAGGQPSCGRKITCMAFLAFLFWTVAHVCLVHAVSVLVAPLLFHSCLCIFRAVLQDQDKRALDQGNKTAEVAFRVVQKCLDNSVASALESPQKSLLFHTDEAVNLGKSRIHHEVDVSMCAFGASFKKLTRVKVWKSGFTLPDRQLVCVKACNMLGKSVCGFTQKPHEVLSGVAGRDFKTKSAEQYPLEFASMFFRLLCPSPV